MLLKVYGITCYTFSLFSGVSDTLYTKIQYNNNTINRTKDLDFVWSCLAEYKEDNIWWNSSIVTTQTFPAKMLNFTVNGLSGSISNKILLHASLSISKPRYHCILVLQNFEYFTSVDLHGTPIFAYISMDVTWYPATSSINSWNHLQGIMITNVR